MITLLSLKESSKPVIEFDNDIKQYIWRFDLFISISYYDNYIEETIETFLSDNKFSLSDINTFYWSFKNNLTLNNLEIENIEPNTLISFKNDFIVRFEQLIKKLENEYIFSQEFSLLPDLNLINILTYRIGEDGAIYFFYSYLDDIFYLNIYSNNNNWSYEGPYTYLSPKKEHNLLFDLSNKDWTTTVFKNTLLTSDYLFSFALNFLKREQNFRFLFLNSNIHYHYRKYKHFEQYLIEKRTS